MKLFKLFRVSIFVGIIVILFAGHGLQAQIIRSNGFIIDVNSDETSILFEVPDDFDSQYSKVKLICYQLRTNSRILLSDSLIADNDLHAKFLNDTIIIVPTNYNILLYNLKSRRYIEKLIKPQPGEYVVTFNIDQDKKKIAFITLNPKKSLFKIYYKDLSRNEIVNISQSPLLTETDSYCKVLVVNNFIIYNVNLMLYVYNIETKNESVITSKLSFNAYGRFLFAADSNTLVYIEGYNKETTVKSYDLQHNMVEQTNLKINVPANYISKIITMDAIFYKGKYRIQLFNDYPYLYIDKYFTKQNNYSYFSGSNIEITRKYSKPTFSFAVFKKK